MADEIKQVMEALDRVEGKMDETSKSNAAELKRLGEEQTKLSRQLMELQQKGVAAKQEAEVKTAGDNVVDADGFKAFRDGSAQKARVELVETFDKKEAVNPITTPTSFRRTVVRASSLVLSVRSRLKVSSRRSRLPRTLLNTSRKRKPRTSTARHSLLKALRSRLVLPPSRPRRARSRRSLTLLACPSS